LICDTLKETARESGARLILDVNTIYPAMHVPEDASVVKLAVRAAEQIGLDPIIRGTGGGSDTHIFNDHGIPCVNLGIAMQKVHTIDEFIRVEDLSAVTSYVLAIIHEAAREA
ncbi:MAG: M20/M25/M40 family metallo-hydrolase, partial [Desulfotomaculaceae bacterium]